MPEDVKIEIFKNGELVTIIDSDKEHAKAFINIPVIGLDARCNGGEIKPILALMTEIFEDFEVTIEEILSKGWEKVMPATFICYRGGSCDLHIHIGDHYRKLKKICIKELKRNGFVINSKGYEMTAFTGVYHPLKRELET